MFCYFDGALIIYPWTLISCPTVIFFFFLSQFILLKHSSVVKMRFMIYLRTFGQEHRGRA